MLQEWGRAGMVTLAPGERRERELSWFDFGTPNSLSADGRMVAFTESGAGVGPDPSALRSTHRRVAGHPHREGRRLEESHPTAHTCC